MAHLKNRPADRDASDVDHIRFRGRDGSIGGHEKPLWRCAVAKSDLHERRGGRLLKEEAPPMAPTQAARTRPQAVWKSETETGQCSLVHQKAVWLVTQPRHDTLRGQIGAKPVNVHDPC